MKKREVFIFVSRNMEGAGYASAYPQCGRAFQWLCENVIIPSAKAAFMKAGASQSVIRTNLDEVRRTEHVALVAGRCVYSVQCVPDTNCTDPLAVGRSPKFEMQAIFDGKPNLFCKSFNDTIEECFNRGWATMSPGVQDRLRFEVPAEVYPE